MKFGWFIYCVVIILTATLVMGRSQFNKPIDESMTPELATKTILEEELSTQKPKTQTVFLTECPKNRLLVDGRCRKINKVV